MVMLVQQPLTHKIQRQGGLTTLAFGRVQGPGLARSSHAALFVAPAWALAGWTALTMIVMMTAAARTDMLTGMAPRVMALEVLLLMGMGRTKLLLVAVAG